VPKLRLTITFPTDVQSGVASKITDWVRLDDKTGEFKRGQSVFRDFISKKPGAEFPPEKGRYHLYVSYACPWGSYLCPSPG
jgi:glutathionyl-hydroquinone reductase